MNPDIQLPHLPDLKWLEPPTCPFPFRCLDVRSFSAQMTAAPVDPLVLERFTALRASTGGHVVDLLPKADILVPCELSYPYNGNSAEGALFKATRMEEKWDIYLIAERLYFSRSWTGELIYLADVRFSFDRVELQAVRAAGRSLKEGAIQIACDVDFLIKSHLFRRAAPFLIPASLPEDDYAAAAYGYSAFGRAAAFATREDPRSLEPGECPVGSTLP
jgi:hypothetical protein